METLMSMYCWSRRDASFQFGVLTAEQDFRLHRFQWAIRTCELVRRSFLIRLPTRVLLPCAKPSQPPPGTPNAARPPDGDERTGAPTAKLGKGDFTYRTFLLDLNCCIIACRNLTVQGFGTGQSIKTRRRKVKTSSLIAGRSKFPRKQTTFHFRDRAGCNHSATRIKVSGPPFLTGRPCK
jgi:hypothetical protein